MAELVMPLHRLAPRTIVLPDHLRDTNALLAWQAACAVSADPVLVVDSTTRVRAGSAAALELLGCPEDAVGKRLLEVVTLVDFDQGEADPEYAERIPPLVVLRQRGLARSLIRIRHPRGLRTLDVVSAPVSGLDGEVAGSVSMLAPVRAG